jgi:GT2 family glycosyltransferase
VVTHRSATTIAATLRCLATPAVDEVVVVDNDSPDDTVAVIEANLPPGARLVRQANVGFGAGNNAGAAALTGRAEAVLFLNPDATIAPTDLATLATYLHEHPTVALVAPSLRQGGVPIGSAGREATVLTEVARALPGPLKRVLPRRPLAADATTTGPVAYVEGACMLFRREALDAVGGFDEGFFLFFEELDVARRLRASGWEVHVVTEAVAEHAVATSRRATPMAGEQHFAASTYRYLAKSRGGRSADTWLATMRVLWWLKAHTGRLTGTDRQMLLSAVAAERSRGR